ncbi:spermatogenesis-associated serine-rich protein 1 [Bombina bombina]|uniref:spermatogenesis-associated serine-rich protein 1 n=1 Tax=Bombina bombina TaxID=8345 RepID=UPI00235A5733|nr:spermatogenesis-associated serine-rich protein 1 [Bombina bombina]
MSKRPFQGFIMCLELLNLKKSVEKSLENGLSTDDHSALSYHGCASRQLQDWYYNPTDEAGTGICLPLIQSTLPAYPNCDLDWKPTARWLPSPQYSDAPFPHIKDIKFPDRIRLLRSCPRVCQGEGSEWSFYPNFGLPFTYHTGKRCVFDGLHLRNWTSLDVKTLPSCLGRRKKVQDSRNGIPLAAPGDKSFSTPEYSPNFHKFGSTRPVVNFRELYTVNADTFIPLQKLPRSPRIPYSIKVQRQQLEEEKRDVKQLSGWKPSPPPDLFKVPKNAQRTNVE